MLKLMVAGSSKAVQKALSNEKSPSSSEKLFVLLQCEKKQKHFEFATDFRQNFNHKNFDFSKFI